MARNHLGEVGLFSRVGMGSTFTLRIPLAGSAVTKKGAKEWAKDLAKQRQLSGADKSKGTGKQRGKKGKKDKRDKKDEKDKKK